MKQHSIFHAPVLSFFSKSLYRDVCHKRKGVGFAYLLLLAVCWIAPVVKVHMELSNFVDNGSSRGRCPAFLLRSRKWPLRGGGELHADVGLFIQARRACSSSRLLLDAVQVRLGPQEYRIARHGGAGHAAFVQDVGGQLLVLSTGLDDRRRAAVVEEVHALARDDW